jgi:hypothetical protein
MNKIVIKNRNKNNNEEEWGFYIDIEELNKLEYDNYLKMKKISDCQNNNEYNYFEYNKYMIQYKNNINNKIKSIIIKVTFTTVILLIINYIIYLFL